MIFFKRMSIYLTKPIFSLSLSKHLQSSYLLDETVCARRSVRYRGGRQRAALGEVRSARSRTRALLGAVRPLGHPGWPPRAPPGQQGHCVIVDSVRERAPQLWQLLDLGQGGRVQCKWSFLASLYFIPLNFWLSPTHLAILKKIESYFFCCNFELLEKLHFKHLDIFHFLYQS